MTEAASLIGRQKGKKIILPWWQQGGVACLLSLTETGQTITTSLLHAFCLVTRKSTENGNR